MLLLAGIDDRLRSQLARHPAHSAEFRRGDKERQPGFADYRFDAEFTPLLLPVVDHNVAHDAGMEVCHRGSFKVAALDLFLADHPGPALRIRRESPGRVPAEGTAQRLTRC